MGDMGEIFREMNAANKERKARNLEAAQQIGAMFTRHTDYHWSYTLHGKRLDYWPSKNKWHWNNGKFTGTPGDLVNFIRKRECHCNVEDPSINPECPVHGDKRGHA